MSTGPCVPGRNSGYKSSATARAQQCSTELVLHPEKSEKSTSSGHPYKPTLGSGSSRDYRPAAEPLAFSTTPPSSSSSNSPPITSGEVRGLLQARMEARNGTKKWRERTCRPSARAGHLQHGLLCLLRARDFQTNKQNHLVSNRSYIKTLGFKAYILQPQ